ncbi:MAG: DNA alkylation repair protein [Thermodesulfobacteriota bacterium]|nr:DNA alkylation repair protein [Thermodesulfobacteriota bacterium]
MNYSEVLKQLKKLSNPEIAKAKRNRGSLAKNAYGIMVKDLKILAKGIGTNHFLALNLFKSGIHEAKKLASMIDEPAKVTEFQMEAWVKKFDSWDICDCCCSSLFVKTPFACKKIFEWCNRKREYEKRAAFSLMAHLVFHDKISSDNKFERFFPIIKQESTDERNFVKKAVNWALRQIGKRNINLNKKAIATAEEIKRLNSKSAQWIANNALNELTKEKINILGYPRN